MFRRAVAPVLVFREKLTSEDVSVEPLDTRGPDLPGEPVIVLGWGGQSDTDSSLGTGQGELDAHRPRIPGTSSLSGTVWPFSRGSGRTGGVVPSTFRTGARRSGLSCACAAEGDGAGVSPCSQPQGQLLSDPPRAAGTFAGSRAEFPQQKGVACPR